MAIGKLHLLLLHFPIALIVTAALADILWLWRRYWSAWLGILEANWLSGRTT